MAGDWGPVVPFGGSTSVKNARFGYVVGTGIEYAFLSYCLW